MSRPTKQEILDAWYKDYRAFYDNALRSYSNLIGDDPYMDINVIMNAVVETAVKFIAEVGLTIAKSAAEDEAHRDRLIKEILESSIGGTEAILQHYIEDIPNLKYTATEEPLFLN